MKDNSKVVVNIVTGLALGAFLGILIAPGKGRTSRRKIDLFFTNLGDSLIDNAENSLSLLGNLKDSLKYSLKENVAARKNRQLGS
jgi:gas vesicle protein